MQDGSGVISILIRFNYSNSKSEIRNYYSH